MQQPFALDRIPVLLMIQSLGPGGSERQLTEFAKGLSDHGLSPHVAYFRDGFRRQELEARHIPLLHLPITSFRSFSAVGAAAQFHQHVRRAGIQIVHAFDTPTACFGLPIARLAGVPIVLSSQRGERRLTAPNIQRIQRFAELFAHGSVVNCLFLQQQLVQAGLFSQDHVHLCYNAIDTLYFSPQPPQRPPQFESKSFLFGSISLYRSEKGLDVLIRAFSLIASQLPDSQLLLVGSGPCEAELRSLAAQLRIESRCHFIPPTGDVRPWLRAFDVFVLPTSSEALSNALLEAMASGLPVVASDVGGNPEIVSNGLNGILFSSGDSTALSQILLTIASNPVLRASLSSHAIETVSTKFSAPVSLASMASLYRRLLCVPNC